MAKEIATLTNDQKQLKQQPSVTQVQNKLGKKCNHQLTMEQRGLDWGDAQSLTDHASYATRDTSIQQTKQNCSITCISSRDRDLKAAEIIYSLITEKLNGQ